MRGRGEEIAGFYVCVERERGGNHGSREEGRSGGASLDVEVCP